MKVYRGVILDPHEGTCYVWASSRKLCTQRAKQAADDMSNPDATCTVEPVDLGRRAFDVGNWLHRNFKRDNG